MANELFSGLRRWRPTVMTVVTLLGGALPALYLWSLVVRYGVEVPTADDWEMAPLIEQAHKGHLSWAGLFAQHEEARTVVPRLIFILSSLGRHWDVRDQMLFSVYLCVLTTLGIYLLLRRTGLSRWSVAFCLWASAFLIFSPAQFDLWTFASGVSSFIPAFCIVGSLLLVASKASVISKFVGCAGLACISTFTLAHGLLAWGCTFPVYLLAGSVPRWRRWLLGWVVAALGCAAVYFYGYSKPVHLPNFAPAISPLTYLQFLCAFAGNTFACASENYRLALATGAGVVILTVLVFVTGYVLKERTDRLLVRRCLPWFALALYSLGSGTLAMLGRIGYGVDWAISSRYVTFSLYLVISAIVLMVWVVPRLLAAPNRQPGSRLALRAVCCVVAVTAAALFAISAFNSVEFLQSIWARNRLARSALLFSRVVDTSSVIQSLNYPMPSLAIARAAALDDLKLLRPRLLATPEIRSLRYRERGGRFAAGWCDAVQGLDAERGRATGWAALTLKGRPADAVVLAFETGDGNWRAFALSDTVVRRRDIAEHLQSEEQLWTGWIATFPRSALPAGAKISAWAFDAESAKLYRLKQNSPELTL